MTSRFYYLNTFILLFIFSLFIVQTGQAAQSGAESKVINQVLFHLQGKAFTQMDLARFLQIETELLKHLQPQQARFIAGRPASTRLLLLEVAGREAASLELAPPEDMKFKSMVQSSAEKNWGSGVTYLQTKQSIFQDEARFEAWIKLVQAKYDFLSKE